MKKILSMLSFVLMLMCVGFAFTSCGDDDDDDELDPENSIVGTWLTESYSGFYGQTTFRKNGTFTIGVHYPDEFMNNEFVKSVAAMTMPAIEGTYSTSNGNKLHITVTKYQLAGKDVMKELKAPNQNDVTYSVSSDNKKLTMKFKDYYTGADKTQVYTRK